MSQYPPPPGGPGQPQYPPQPPYPQQPGYQPQGGWQGQQGGYPPPPPGGYQQPPAGYGPPPGYGAPPGQGGQQQPVQQKRGCGGCLLGCLAVFIVGCLALTVVFVAGVFMFRSAFPTAESFGEATTCAALRVVIVGFETMVESGEMSAAERREADQALKEIRAEYEAECGALP